MVEYAFSPTGRPMSIRFAIGLCAFVYAVACAGQPGLDAIAEGYVRAALKLSQHDPSLVEQWRGPEAWTPGPRRPVAELQQDVERLHGQVQTAAADVSSAVEYARVQYLGAQIRALRYAVERQLGRHASIDEQARDEFNVTFPPLDARAIARAREELERLLPGSHPLAGRVTAFRRAVTIPRERRLAVLTEAIAACRTAMPRLAAAVPDGTIDLVFKSQLGWDAFARYEGGDRTQIQIDDDGDLDITRAARLACHEGYPGHHVQHMLIDRVYLERQWPELLLTPGFGPHLLYAEGAAEAAADLALPASRRADLYRTTLLPAAELDPSLAEQLVKVEELLNQVLPVVTDVARQYLASEISRERAIERLRDEALISNPHGTLTFIEQRRARALVYGEGRRIVIDHIDTRDLASLYAAFRRAAALQ